MSYARAARIRVTPEAMTSLLPLPADTAVIRFQVAADGSSIEALAVGDSMPEVRGTPDLLDSTELPLAAPAPSAWAPAPGEVPIVEVAPPVAATPAPEDLEEHLAEPTA